MRFVRSYKTGDRIRYVNSIFFINVFVILLVFVAFFPEIVSTVGITVALPRVITGESVSSKVISIIILGDDSIFFESRRTTVAALENILARQKLDYQVLIKADEKASVGILARVWDAARQAGCKTVSIATND